MSRIRWKSLCAFLAIFVAIGSHPVRSDEELNPLTLTWNQVHHLVRENLFEINELRKENTAILGALRHCVGFDTCLSGNSLFDDPNFSNGNDFNNFDNGPGALIASLNRRMLTLEEYQKQLEYEINEKKEILYRQKVDNYRRQGGSWSQQSSLSSSQSGSPEHGTPRRTQQGSSSSTGGASSSSQGGWSVSSGSQQTSQRQYSQSGWSSQGGSSGGGRVQPDSTTNIQQQGSRSRGGNSQSYGHRQEYGQSGSTPEGGRQPDSTHRGWSSSSSGSQSSRGHDYDSRQGHGQGGRHQPESSPSSEGRRQQGWSSSSSGASRQGVNSYGRNQQSWSSSKTQDSTQKPGSYQHGFSWNSAVSSSNSYDDDDDAPYPDHVVIGGSGRRGSSWTSSSSLSQDQRRRLGGEERNEGNARATGQAEEDQRTQNQGSTWSSGTYSSSQQSGSVSGSRDSEGKTVYSGSRGGTRGSSSSFSGTQQAITQRPVYGTNTNDRQTGGSWSSGSHSSSSAGDSRRRFGVVDPHGSNTEETSQSIRTGGMTSSSQRGNVASSGGTSSQSGAVESGGHIHGTYEEGSYWNSELRGKSQRAGAKGLSAGASGGGYGVFGSEGNGDIPKSYEWSPSSENEIYEGSSVQYAGNVQQVGTGSQGVVGGHRGHTGTGYHGQGGGVSGYGGQETGGVAYGGQGAGGVAYGGQGTGGVAYGGQGAGSVAYGGQGAGSVRYGGQGAGSVAYGGQVINGQRVGYGGQGVDNGQGGVWISSSSSTPGGNGTIWTKTYSYSSNPDGSNQGYNQGSFQNSSWSRSYSYSSNDAENRLLGTQVPGMQQGVFANGSSYVMIDPRQLGIQGIGEDGLLLNGSSWISSNSLGNGKVILGPQKQGQYGYSYQYSSSKSSSNPYVHFNKDLQMTPINQHGGIRKLGSDDQDPRGVSGKKK